MQRIKLLNIGLIISSLFGYLEWGSDQSMFLYEGEWEVLSKLFTAPLSVLHPFTVLPLLGQLLLLITLFQKRPHRGLNYLGLGGISLLFLLMFFIGLITMNYKIFLSTLPFLVLGVLLLRQYRRIKK